MWGKIFSYGGAALATVSLGWGYAKNGSEIFGFVGKTVNLYSLEDKIKTIEASQKQTIGPEGARGPQGVPGRQGDQGVQGERGLPGPKGDSGVTPAQFVEVDKKLAIIAELQQRVTALEKRLSQTQARQPAATESVQVANADSSAPIRPVSIAGFKRHDSGCLYLPPNFQPFSYTLRIGDRFCDNNGENGSTVMKMTDSVVSFNNNTCYLKNTCSAVFSNRALFSIERIDEDARSKSNVATVQVIPRN